MEMKFEHNSFGKRLRSMLKVDFRRMRTMRLFYIMMGICLVMPILILVMTTMMDGSVSVDPQTGAETVMEGFDNTWQIIGTASGESSSADMSMTSMCNINLLSSLRQFWYVFSYPRISKADMQKICSPSAQRRATTAFGALLRYAENFLSHLQTYLAALYKAYRRYLSHRFSIWEYQDCFICTKLAYISKRIVDGNESTNHKDFIVTISY